MGASNGVIGGSVSLDFVGFIADYKGSDPTLESFLGNGIGAGTGASFLVVGTFADFNVKDIRVGANWTGAYGGISFGPDDLTISGSISAGKTYLLFDLRNK